MSNDNCTHEVFSFWMYRNGKISNQVDDYEKSARRVTKELANLSYSNNPSLDIMYFSGLVKISIAKNKAILIETCIRPTLDQMLNLKDCELKFLDKNGKIVGIEFLTLDVPDDLVNSLILFDELKDESELLNKLIETSRAAAGH